MVAENIHTSPTEGIGNSREREVTKAQKFKAMYEAKLEFLKGWGIIGQILSVGRGGGVWIFSGTTQCAKDIYYNKILTLKVKMFCVELECM